MLETALQAELSQHLGYEKGDAGAGCAEPAQRVDPQDGAYGSGAGAD